MLNFGRQVRTQRVRRGFPEDPQVGLCSLKTTAGRRQRPAADRRGVRLNGGNTCASRFIHATELPEILPLKDRSIDAFLSIASQDEQLKIAHGRYVFLAEWEGPRREAIGHAVATVLEGSARSLTLEEIAAVVEKRIGRKIDKPVVSGALQALEAEFNGATGKWCLSKPSSEDDIDTPEETSSASLDVGQASI